MKRGMLHHVEIYVSDLVRSTEFWKWLLERFGHQQYQKWESGISFRFFEDPDRIKVEVVAR